MENAIYITKISQFKYVSGKYSRLYYGNEFCERLIPSVGDLKKALSLAEKKELAFSLVTPYVTNIGVKKLMPLFELLKDSRSGCEIIVNDWGILSLVHREYPNLTLVLGRLLIKQKRGPGLKQLLRRNTRTRLIKDSKNPNIKVFVFQKKLPLDLDPYYKGSNASSVPVIHNFLISQGIRRIELDNTEQGLFLELPRNKIFASLYLPYVYISTTFFCPTAGCHQMRRSLLKIKPCKKECQRYIFKLRHKTMPKVIYLKGNTQFYKNTKSHFKEWKKLGVDRVVYEPEIPV